MFFSNNQSHGYLIDTNVLIQYLSRFFDNSDLDQYLTQGVYVNELILGETLNFIQNKYSAKHSIASQKQIIDNPEIFELLEITNEVRLLAWQVRQKYADNKLSYVDSVILAQAKIFNFTILTQDKAMIASGFAQGFDPLAK